MTDETSISARTIDALNAIAKAGHDIADALRETGRQCAEQKWEVADLAPMIAKLNEVVAELAQIDACVPAEQPRARSGDSRTLGDRLRAAADYQDRPGAYDELRAMADEADRLERERGGARIKGAQWKARYAETQAFARWATVPDHPLGKVIGVIRECGTEHYKTENAPTENPFRMPEDRAPVTDWAEVEHTADQCQFEECPRCGCCAHGKEHVIGCSTTLDRPLGTECPNPDCACKGGVA